MNEGQFVHKADAMRWCWKVHKHRVKAMNEYVNLVRQGYVKPRRSNIRGIDDFEYAGMLLNNLERTNSANLPVYVPPELERRFNMNYTGLEGLTNEELLGKVRSLEKRDPLLAELADRLMRSMDEERWLKNELNTCEAQLEDRGDD